jgi:hypothetical protein
MSWGVRIISGNYLNFRMFSFADLLNVGREDFFIEPGNPKKKEKSEK